MKHINIFPSDILVMCPSGWSKILDGCYLFVKNTVTWVVAQATCASKGGVLAIPTSYASCDYLSKKASSAGLVDPWIGAARG
jgi:hypothetical protein